MLFVYSAIFLLLPATALAWGPGTHLDLALEILKHLAWAAPAIQRLVEKHPDEFIYGSVSPDILVGKKYAGAIHHCHNWQVGHLILAEAKTEPEKASAWGYLTHLAADTVAHNYFVPYKIIHSFSKASLGHVYWEMRFDIHVPETSWRELEHVIRHDFSPFDHLLERVLKKTLFSFRTSKKIFNSILILHKMKQLRFGLKTYARASRWALHKENVEHYRALTKKTVLEFLKHPEKARCLAADPAGTRKIKYAAETSRLLRKWKGGEPERFIAKVRQKLEEGLFDPQVSLPSLSEELLRFQLGGGNPFKGFPPPS